VAAFLQDRIGFYDIPAIARDCMAAVPFIARPTLEEVFSSHEEALVRANGLIEKIAR
jgi:1-deoxy-D-xylulose 5-phosphate reductoisomerase